MLVDRLSYFIATSFYTGYFPIAPGTVGSGLALIIFYVFPELRGLYLFLLTGLVFFIGVWAATEVEKTDGHDASIINIDEVVGMWVSLLFLPAGISGIWWWVGAFFVFRAFDVVKPFPVGWSQKLPGGWGVMVDDVLAGIYTNLLLRLLYVIFVR
ncbi:MAG: phosphatidylglycerophosphatase A [Candidatus Neomarinimicrobiota bacterium]|nr:MAG: phosphatidylglycerophosphatase A [Candidatus Neomarinimicrobiota bacterium]